MTLHLDLASTTHSAPFRSLNGFAVRTVDLSDSATVTLDVDEFDIGILATVSQPILFANPTGTPFNGQSIQIRITSAVSRALTFGADYDTSSLFGLPAFTTGGSKEDWLKFVWNSTTSKWVLVGTTIGVVGTSVPTISLGQVLAARANYF